MIESAFTVVMGMSASAAVVILAVLLLRLLLRKIPKVYSYMLWLLVLARLLCPVFPEARFSPMPREISGIRVMEAAVSEGAMPDVQTDTAPGTEETYGTAQTPASEPAAVRHEPVSVQSVLAVLWAAGAAALFAWGVVSYILVKRRLKAVVPLRENAYLADHIDTPFVIGLIRPRIYLPSDLAEDWVPHILLHEQFHIRRADPVVKFLFYLALCLHWFNPLVWLAYWLMGRDMEMSCDEAVMKKLGVSARAEYAESLLCLATGRRSAVAAPLAFGEGDPQRRIVNVLNYRKPKFWVCFLAVMLCAAAAVLLLTDRPAQRPSQLEYPGLQWNMSPEEVKQALGISDDMVVQEQETFPHISENEIEYEYYSYHMYLQDYTCFGQKAKTVIFSFIDYNGSGEHPGLHQILIYYPDEMDENTADMDAVRKRLTAIYGKDSSSYSYMYAGINDIRTVKTYPPNCRWIPEARSGEYLTEEELEKIMQYYRNLYQEQNITGGENPYVPELSEWDELIRDYPLVTLSCAEYNKLFDLHPDENRRAGMTEYYIQFDASALVKTLWYLSTTEAKTEQTICTMPRDLRVTGLFSFPALGES